MPAIWCWVLAAVPHNSTLSLTGRSSGAQGETLCWNSLVMCWSSHISLQGSGQSRTTHAVVCPVRPQFTPLFPLALGIPFTRYLSWHEKFYGWTWLLEQSPCFARPREESHPVGHVPSSHGPFLVLLSLCNHRNIFSLLSQPGSRSVLPCPFHPSGASLRGNSHSG